LADGHKDFIKPPLRQIAKNGGRRRINAASEEFLAFFAARKFPGRSDELDEQDDDRITSTRL
jgi:hypothetical protein